MSTNEPLLFRVPTSQDLFPEKVASALSRMPDDEKKWPAHIYSEILRELPFLAQYDVEIVLDRTDPEAGAALGYAQVRNKTMSRPQDNIATPGNIIRVPIIVQERRLQKFYVFEAGKQVYPLNEARVEQAMLNPAVFDTDATRLPASASLMDQLYPPSQSRNGFGRVVDPSSMGLSKISSAGHVAKEILREVAPGAGLGAAGALVGAGLKTRDDVDVPLGRAALHGAGVGAITRAAFGRRGAAADTTSGLLMGVGAARSANAAQKKTAAAFGAKDTGNEESSKGWQQRLTDIGAQGAAEQEATAQQAAAAAQQTPAAQEPGQETPQEVAPQEAPQGVDGRDVAIERLSDTVNEALRHSHQVEDKLLDMATGGAGAPEATAQVPVEEDVEVPEEQVLVEQPPVTKQKVASLWGSFQQRAVNGLS